MVSRPDWGGISPKPSDLARLLLAANLNGMGRLPDVISAVHERQIEAETKRLGAFG